MIMSDAFLARLKRDGLRTREYSPPSGGGVACTVTAQDDLLVARLAADLSTAARVDLVMYDQTGAEQRRLRDIPVSAARHEVIYNEPIDAARGFPATVLIMKLLAVDEREERVLGAYTFQHTPS
jgi:hypothetical protein